MAENYLCGLAFYISALLSSSSILTLYTQYTCLVIPQHDKVSALTSPKGFVFFSIFSFLVFFVFGFMEEKQTSAPFLYLKVVNLSSPQFSSVFSKPVVACPPADETPDNLA